MKTKARPFDKLRDRKLRDRRLRDLIRIIRMTLRQKKSLIGMCLPLQTTS